MLFFNRQTDWRGIGTTVMVESLTLLVLVFVVATYVDWSSSRAVAEFSNAIRPSAADPNYSSDSSARMQPHAGRTGCPRGNKPLPAQLLPLP